MARVLGLIFVVAALLFPVVAAAAGCDALRATLAGAICRDTADGYKVTCTTKAGGVDGQGKPLTEVWRHLIAPWGTDLGDSRYAVYSCSKCSIAEPYPASYGDNISVCKSGCMYEPDADSTTDTVRSGSWFAQLKQGMYRPTGDVCDSATMPEPPAASGTICGGSSCHDTHAGKYCAGTEGGGQVCISDKPPPSGGCASSGNVTLCAGNPPPMPPNPPIADPPSDIGGSDTYGHQDGSGAISSTTVNNYSNNNAAPSSGANPGAGDVAPPASGGTGGTGGDGGTGGEGEGDKGDTTHASGGGDCNTPPICEGNQAVCMTVSQTWLLRCSGGKDTSGAAGQDGNTDVPGLDGIGDGPGEGFFKSEDVLSKLDSGGLVGATTCPAFVVLDLDAYGIHTDSSSSPWCDILDKAGYMLMFLAAFISLRILSSK